MWATSSKSSTHYLNNELRLDNVYIVCVNFVDFFPSTPKSCLNLFNSWNCVKLHNFFSLQEFLSHKVGSKFIWTMNYLESDRALEWQICQQRAHFQSKFNIGQTFNVKFAFIHTQSNSLLSCFDLYDRNCNKFMKCWRFQHDKRQSCILCYLLFIMYITAPKYFASYGIFGVCIQTSLMYKF
jgi:hypothetical protein